MTATAALNIVWFKRDLRIAAHSLLAQAAERGRVLPPLLDCERDTAS